MEPPRPPDDIEMKNIIDKLAQFVARNGPEFENMTKSKQENNPKFAFLWGGPYFNYYTYKVTTEQTLLRSKGGGGLLGAGPPGAAGPPRPLMDIDFGRAPVGGNNWGGEPPEPPNTTHITDAIANITNQQTTMREQVAQSEQNLAAQWAVLQQNNEAIALNTILKAKEQELEDLSRATNISLSIYDSVLEPIIETCTKDSISNGKSWIFQNSNSKECNKLLANYLNFKVTVVDTEFTTKLHLIYLVNDVLHHCVRKNNHELKVAFQKAALSMYCAAASCASEEQMPKLGKLVTLWETKSRFFDDDTLDQMKHFDDTFKKFKSDLKSYYEDEIAGAIKAGNETYEGYKDQHEQFAVHVQTTLQQQDKELENLQQQLRSIEAEHQARMAAWNQHSANNVHQQNMGGDSGGRKSRWDKTAPVGGPTPHQGSPANMGGHMGMGMGNMGGGHPPQDMRHFSGPPPATMSEGTIPTVPYYDLPAGLMVPLIRFDDSEYKPIDPSAIRLPPPQPPSERLMAAVDYFYAPPTHDRPRDPDGWERLALYEWSREKQFAIKQKKNDIESGRRPKSESPSPIRRSRSNSPDQIVPAASKRRSRKHSGSRSRSRSRTRSRSRGSTPPRSRGSTKHYRDRTRSRSRTRSRTRSRSKDRSRSRSREYDLPRHLTKRSPSPVARAGFKY